MTTKFFTNKRKRGLLIAAFSFLLPAFTACTSPGNEPKAADEQPLTAVSAPAAEPGPAPMSTPVAPAPDRVYDLYVMSMCPYGFTAVAELSELARAFPERELNVWFIGRVEGDKLSSLRGEPEIFDKTLWLGVKALYPARYREFLGRRGSPEPKTEALLKDMGFDVAKIRRWAEENGRAELREHYLRGQRVGANASPTLFIDHNRYNGRVSGGQLVRAKCRAVDPMPRFCMEYPECVADADCYKPGKLAKCAVPEADGKKGRAVCEYWDDVSFELTVLVADTASDAPERNVISAMTNLLPGVRVNTVKFSSEEGKRLAKRYNPSALPFYHFEKAAENAQRFISVKHRLEEIDGGYTFKKGEARANFFPQRPYRPGAIEVYADPFMADIGKVIGVVLSSQHLAGRVVLRPAAPVKNPQYKTPPALDRARSEEALRWITLANDFSKSGYRAYLEQYAADSLGSGSWLDWLGPAKISQSRLLGKLSANSAKMAAYWEDFEAISGSDPIMIMLNNRIKITTPNVQELERMLGLIKL